MDLSNHAIEHAVIAASGKAFGAGSVTAIGSGVAMKVTENPEIMSVADIGVYTGMFVGIAGLIVHVVAQWRRDLRESKLFRMKLDEAARAKRENQ